MLVRYSMHRYVIYMLRYSYVWFICYIHDICYDMLLVDVHMLYHRYVYIYVYISYQLTCHGPYDHYRREQHAACAYQQQLPPWRCVHQHQSHICRDHIEERHDVRTQQGIPQHAFNGMCMYVTFMYTDSYGMFMINICVNSLWHYVFNMCVYSRLWY